MLRAQPVLDARDPAELLPILAEFFPGRIRYTSVSVPHHIGNGWRTGKPQRGFSSPDRQRLRVCGVRCTPLTGGLQKEGYPGGCRRSYPAFQTNRVL
jgi:hypothetical protein